MIGELGYASEQRKPFIDDTVYVVGTAQRL
jgi:hypothetical protein